MRKLFALMVVASALTVGCGGKDSPKSCECNCSCVDGTCQCKSVCDGDTCTVHKVKSN